MHMDFIFKGTPKPWHIPHLSEPDTTCNCTFILCESCCGSIATVNYSKEGAHCTEGDNPPLDEAVWNGKLIYSAPDLLDMLVKIRQNTELFSDEIDAVLNKIFDFEGYERT